MTLKQQQQFSKILSSHHRGVRNFLASRSETHRARNASSRMTLEGVSSVLARWADVEQPCTVFLYSEYKIDRRLTPVTCAQCDISTKESLGVQESSLKLINPIASCLNDQGVKQ